MINLKIKGAKKHVKQFIIKKYPYLIPLFRLPVGIAIESSNYCNLKCVTCPTPSSMERPRGNMSMETFKTLLKQLGNIKRLNYLRWTFAGEPLVNTKIFDMIKLAFEMGIKSKIDTNGMLLDNFVNNVIIDSGVDIINIAFEISDKDKKAPQFRVGYDFNKVFNSIKLLREERNKKGVKHPTISLNCLLHKYSEPVMNEAIKLGKECGADWLMFKSININVSSLKSSLEFNEMAEKWLPSNPDYLRYKKNKNQWNTQDITRPYICPSVFYPVVLWNGDVTVCCLDYNGEFTVGNIHKESLLSIWTGQKYNKIRKLAINYLLPICTSCTPSIPQKKIELNEL